MEGVMHLFFGFVIVFVILSVVILCTYALTRWFIPWTEEVWPEPEPPKDPKAIDGGVRNAIEAAVAQITDGKGKIANIRKVS